MGWQEDLKLLGEQLTSGQITTAEYRQRSEALLEEAEREAATTQARPKTHIPVSAAWEAPSGEMTQIVGTEDRTTLVGRPVTEGPDRTA